MRRVTSEYFINWRAILVWLACCSRRDTVGDFQVLETLTEWQSNGEKVVETLRSIYDNYRVEMREVEGLSQELIREFEKAWSTM